VAPECLRWTKIFTEFNGARRRRHRAVAMQLPREVTVSGGGQLAASLMAA